jgi:hypothetical protein
MINAREEYALMFTDDMDKVIENLIPMVYGQIKEQLGDGDRSDWAVLGAGIALAATKTALKMLQNESINKIMAKIKPFDVQ